MRIVDANVLLYASNEDAPAHAVAAGWLRKALDETETIGLPWLVLLAYVRLATHPAVFARPLTVAQATDQVRRWLEAPCVVAIEPTDRHLTILAGLLAEAGTAGNLVNDAHVAALAIEHGATIVSFDADFTRFRGVRFVRPAA